MSAERRYNERRYGLEESTTTNGGTRTVFTETMTPGTAVPPHFHLRFSETFDLITGSMTVFTTSGEDVDGIENSGQALEIGRPVTVPPGQYHMYKVGDETTLLRVILTPGDPDFERTLKILNGMAEDGTLNDLGDDVELMAIIMELCDAHLVGPAKTLLDGVWSAKKDEIRERKAALLQKYDTEDALKDLLLAAEHNQ